MGREHFAGRRIERPVVGDKLTPDREIRGQAIHERGDGHEAATGNGVDTPRSALGFMFPHITRHHGEGVAEIFADGLLLLRHKHHVRSRAKTDGMIIKGAVLDSSFLRYLGQPLL